MEKLGIWLRGFFTFVILGLAIWGFGVTWASMGSAPIRDAAGNVTVDSFQRAKDVLLVVLPLVTTCFGYWFGTQGREKAEKREQAANEKFNAVIATSKDPAILAEARLKYPEAFGTSPS